MPDKPTVKRCAIYTRKSSEDGLEQDFNSLDAQREACAAFIQSQKNEGWSLLPGLFDDGGVSGGTLKRPALQRLLEAVEAGQVDVVVVYKVDRLTRSLADFAKIVEAFDARGVSFVSVTQQFNTTSSMGRLTLNVLLSFAQFEREVTGERIRDKIAASKARGIWMGGLVPFGYAAKDRSLVIVDAEAAVVRSLFALYREYHSVPKVYVEAARRGYATRRGGQPAGKPFSRGHIHKLLTNPVYAGRIAHKGQIHEGLHEAIIPAEEWEAVQILLMERAARPRGATTRSSPSILRGLLIDEAGRVLRPSHANKRGRRYRYYVTPPDAEIGRADPDGWRLPAREIEDAVRDALVESLRQPRALIAQLHYGKVPGILITKAERAGRTLAAQISKRGDDRLRALIDRIEITPSKLRIKLKTAALEEALGIECAGTTAAPVTINAPIAFRRRGVELRAVLEANGEPQAHRDERLIRAVAQGHAWFQILRSDEALTIKALAKRLDEASNIVARQIEYAFLAPDIIEAILAGRQPIDLTADALRRIGPIPGDWADQRRLLGFPAI